MSNDVDYFNLADGRRIFVVTEDDGSRAYCAEHNGEQTIIWRTDTFDPSVLLACLLHESLASKSDDDLQEDVESVEDQAQKIIEDARQSIAIAVEPVDPGFWLKGLAFHDAIQVLIDLGYQIVGENQDFTNEKQARLALDGEGKVASSEFSSH